MAGTQIKRGDLEKSIAGILKNADLSKLTSKVVRQKLEKEFRTNLNERKKEVDALLMKMISEVNGDTKDSDNSQSEEDDSDNVASPHASSSKKSKLSDEALARQLQESENKARNRSTKKPQPKTLNKKSKSSKSSEGKDKKKSGFGKEMSLSPELAELVGQNMMSRAEVVKRMWQVIRERKLEDPKNKRFTICDSQLQKIFGCKRFLTFSMMKYLKKHVKDPELLSSEKKAGKGGSVAKKAKGKKVKATEEKEVDEEKASSDDDEESDDEKDSPDSESDSD